MREAPATPLNGRTAWARGMATPLREYLSAETGSAVVLLLAVVAALLWANSPWPGSYASVWTAKLSIQIAGVGLSADLQRWISDGLMTCFFVVVGLEAKRELDVGELRDRRRLALPVVAAIGGMAVPVAIYLAFNAGGDGARGWGAAMPTDVALALGVLALLQPRGVGRLRPFLLTFSIVDDLVSIVVIATVYAEHVSLTALAVAAGLFLVLLALRYAPAGRGAAAAVVAVGLWVALWESGIHPTAAGLAIGLVTSAYPPSRADLEQAIALTRAFREQPTPELARAAQLGLLSAVSPNERLQHRLHPWTSFVIVPLFALSSAGVHLDGPLLASAVRSPVTIGLFAAFVIGKPVGLLCASWLAARTTLRGPPLPVSWPGLAGLGAVTGVAFTVSTLIAGMAFHGARLEQAKVGILGGAIGAALLAAIVFRVVGPRLPAAVLRHRPLDAVDELVDLRADVDPVRDHIRGADDAPVTLVEYGDYECRHCGRAEPVIRDLLASFGDDLRYVWRHLPLSDVHPHAELAAEGAEAAGAQGAFWEMHDTLLAHQDALTARDLLRHAQRLGLDAERFWEELLDGVYAPRVAEDVASADAAGVVGTPTFFVNGRRHRGSYDIATLSAAVHAARARARAAAAV